jgi:hypothetical protein
MERPDVEYIPGASDNKMLLEYQGRRVGLDAK